MLRWHPAYRWRELNYRLLYGTWEPVALMKREKFKWKPHKNQSTDARNRGGIARSSEEAFVIKVERRGLYCLA
ncbi:hypothetical protein NEOC84_000721|nr:hypothetical protein [Neochlamydia sp. AcF84]